jgi:predicted metal-dependent peptidase
MTPRQLLGKARVHTFEYVPYLASYIYALREQEEPRVGTAAVDAQGTLYWSPEYIAKADVGQAAYIITHEVLHLIFDHHKRSVEMLGEHMTETERYICNIAADLVIEQTLAMMRHLRPPAVVHLGAKVPKLGITLDFPPNHSMQEYYRLITEKLRGQDQDGSSSSNQGEDGNDDDSGDDGAGSSPPSGSDTSDGAGQDGDDSQDPGEEDAAGGSEGSAEDGQGKDATEPGAPGTGGSCADGQPRPYEVESDGSWDAYGCDMAAAHAAAAIAQAEQSNPGSVPGAIKQAIKQRLNPQPDPFDQLRSAVCTSVASPVGGRDFTHRRRSRKQPPGDDQPLLHGRITVQPHAVVVVDTSSSMMRADIQARALSVIAQGLRKLSRVKVYCADTTVQSNKWVATTRLFDWHGGGGTDMQSVLKEIEAREKPDSIVMVTDAETYWTADWKPRARVVMAYTGRVGSHWHAAIPKWARVVPIAREEA